jgi:aldehyde dehydrogenase (NAD+)
VSWRIEQLKAIKAMIEASRDAMREAQSHDLHRNETDADLMDIDINVHEAEFALAHLHDWMKPRREATPIVMEPGHVRVRRDPFGVTLVIGAWNEPFMLTLGPLVSAIAAQLRHRPSLVRTASTPSCGPASVNCAVTLGAGRSSE